MKRTFVIDVISSILLLVFLYTSISKLMAYDKFRSVLSDSPLLRPYSKVLAWLLPATEISIVILLFIPPLRLKGLISSFILISFFTFYLTYVVLNHPKLPCNCGGVLSSLSWKHHILLNLLLIVMTVTGIIMYRKQKNLVNKSPP